MIKVAYDKKQTDEVWDYLAQCAGWQPDYLSRVKAEYWQMVIERASLKTPAQPWPAKWVFQHRYKAAGFTFVVISHFTPKPASGHTTLELHYLTALQKVWETPKGIPPKPTEVVG